MQLLHRSSRNLALKPSVRTGYVMLDRSLDGLDSAAATWQHDSGLKLRLPYVAKRRCHETTSDTISPTASAAAAGGTQRGTAKTPSPAG